MAIYFIGAILLIFSFYVFASFFAAMGFGAESSGEMIEYITLIISFLPLFFAVFLIHKYWHSRPIRTLLTYTHKFRWGHAMRAMIATFAVYIISTPIVFYFDPEPLTLMTDWRLYALGLLMTLLFIPFQAAAEEIAIRGYLNQALVKYLKYPWLIFIVTSGFFAWLHVANPEAEGQMLTYMIAIFGFGLLMCALLYFEGGLESAIGVHIANNIFAFSIIGYEDPDLPELAIWSTGPPDISLGESLLELGVVAVTIAVVLLWNRRADNKNLTEQRVS